VIFVIFYQNLLGVYFETSAWLNITHAKIINKKMKGSNTKIQETISYPDLQIRFNIHVHNSIYKIFIMNTAITLGVLQEYEPTQ
jgi:hypothetical protein